MGPEGISWAGAQQIHGAGSRDGLWSGRQEGRQRRAPQGQPLVARPERQLREWASERGFSREPRVRGLEARGQAQRWARARLALTPLGPQLTLEQRCRELRARGRRLEETLPRRIGSEEQRELLSLLCRVHELEVENTEMQSHALLRDGALRHRREALRRLEQHRSLCDEIIQGQRQIIDGRARAPRGRAAHGPHRPAEGPRARAEPCPSPGRLQLGRPAAPAGAVRRVRASAGRGQPGAGRHHGPRGLWGPAGGRPRPEHAHTR